MSSITEAMRDMPPNEALAYKQGVEAGVEFVLARIIARFHHDDELVTWAFDARARFKEHTV